jgi:hypothetical protein
MSPPPAAAASGHSKVPFPPEESDILRRRLLGLKDVAPEPKSVMLPKPKFGPPSATITSQEAAKLASAAAGSAARVLEAADVSVKAVPTPAAKTPSDRENSYKTTSVLKHLLHRYTADATDNNKKEI